MKSNSKRARVATAVAVIVLLTIGYLLNWGTGTLSAPGTADVSVLCPLGALGTMIATKTLIPRAVVSLVVMAVAMLLFARAFCGWACPIPLVERLRDLFAKNGRSKARPDAEDKAYAEVLDAAAPHKGVTTPLTAEELASLSAACPTKRGKRFDSRHWVLLGALASTLAFGWPVFCLVCPIGLTFATIFLVVNLFAGGDVTWTVVVVPALLLAEVVFFRKWCHSLCPISALMSLVGKANRTFVPTIDDKKCRETAKDTRCDVCARVCGEGINPRHPQLSQADWSECTKCRACVDACPEHAISMPLLPKKRMTESRSSTTL